MPSALMDLGDVYTEVYIFMPEPDKRDWRCVREKGTTIGWVHTDHIHYSGGMPVFKKKDLRTEETQ